jgi:hypothetical protein
MPVSAIMPDAAAERYAWAEETDSSTAWNLASVCHSYSNRGSAIPPRTAATT